MKTAFLGLRISSELEDLVRRYGPGSTAAQALILIGASALGADLRSVLADATLLSRHRRLAPQVQRELQAQINKMLNIPLIFEPAPAGLLEDPPELLELLDPLLSVGIEV